MVRKVDYARVEPGVARELLIRHALLEGDREAHHGFLSDNTKLIAEVRALEDRLRRRDLLVDDEVLFDFYDRRLPPGITSTRHFDRWWNGSGQRGPTFSISRPRC